MYIYIYTYTYIYIYIYIYCKETFNPNTTINGNETIEQAMSITVLKLFSAQKEQDPDILMKISNKEIRRYRGSNSYAAPQLLNI